MKKTIKKPVKKEVKKEVKKYEISVKMFGKVYPSKGISVIDALRNLQIPGKIGGMCIVQMNKDNIHREKIINGNHLWRLINGSNMMKLIAEKQLKTLFGEI